MDILQIQSLAVGYGPEKVLQNISFTVQAGQFVSVVAPNGAGKSTLLKTIAGVLPPLRGRILLQGQALASFSRREAAQRIAVVGTDVTNFDYTAMQTVLLGRFAHIRRFSGPSAEDRSIVRAAMEAVDIWYKRSHPCGELSQGERQKVIIARALAQQPKLLLLDEPTAHLDSANQYSVLKLIKKLALQKNMAVIAVLHDINLALAFGTHLLLLHAGRILDFGDPLAVATPANLKKMYGVDFTLYHHGTATFVWPNMAVGDREKQR